MNREVLFKYQDLKYRDFSSKLLPNIDKNKIIGIRIPILKKLAKNIDFVSPANPYFEEVMLEGLSIANLKEIDLVKGRLSTFIPKIDNWSICDSVAANLKIIGKYKDEFIDYLLEYKNGSEYEKRFMLVTFLDYYLDDKHINIVKDTILSISYNNHYECMAGAWLLSKMYINYKNMTLEILKSKHLDKNVKKIAIAKIADSYQVSIEDKEKLKLEV